MFIGALDRKDVSGRSQVQKTSAVSSVSAVKAPAASQQVVKVASVHKAAENLKEAVHALNAAIGGCKDIDKSLRKMAKMASQAVVKGGSSNAEYQQEYSSVQKALSDSKFKSYDLLGSDKIVSVKVSTTLSRTIEIKGQGLKDCLSARHNINDVQSAKEAHKHLYSKAIPSVEKAARELKIGAHRIKQSCNQRSKTVSEGLDPMTKIHLTKVRKGLPS